VAEMTATARRTMTPMGRREVAVEAITTTVAEVAQIRMGHPAALTAMDLRTTTAVATTTPMGLLLLVATTTTPMDRPTPAATTVIPTGHLTKITTLTGRPTLVATTMIRMARPTIAPATMTLTDRPRRTMILTGHPTTIVATTMTLMDRPTLVAMTTILMDRPRRTMTLTDPPTPATTTTTAETSPMIGLTRASRSLLPKPVTAWYVPSNISYLFYRPTLLEQDEKTADKIGDGLREGLNKFGGGNCKSIFSSSFVGPKSDIVFSSLIWRTGRFLNGHNLKCNTIVHYVHCRNHICTFATFLASCISSSADYIFTRILFIRNCLLSDSSLRLALRLSVIGGPEHLNMVQISKSHHHDLLHWLMLLSQSPIRNQH